MLGSYSESGSAGFKGSTKSGLLDQIKASTTTLEEAGAQTLAFLREHIDEPDVIWDGYVNPEKLTDAGKLQAEYAICVDNGGAEVLNVDLGNDSANIVHGDEQHACRHDVLPPVVLTPPLDG